MFFVIQRGSLANTKMEYSYGRRAQSTLHSMQWKDIATIQAETARDAGEFATKYIKDAGWAKDGGSWQLEGRGEVIGQTLALSPFADGDDHA